MRGWAIFCSVFAVVQVLIFSPEARRQRRLRRHGRVITAVCLEHFNARGDGPIRVRCGYLPDPDGGQVRAIVQTHERIPQVGEELKVLYDPRDPQHAENLDITRGPAFGRGDIVSGAMWAGFFLIGAGCAAAAD
ncbi:DUF3592 domain-containing protein [Streptomyces sp. NBC_00038]|uniref:DUF3592 domain-containing protein n=1 Tax=Streptomyces sp. NBC_00038 TaxID=2903615 RepID=UPI00225537D5|nr:DUF3592 domain-containing protein [Streptomyces sp. NBC_00038]MCX5560160.1 hypothetical protein [Streptomyces sp. NBC_00038]